MRRTRTLGSLTVAVVGALAALAALAQAPAPAADQRGQAIPKVATLSATWQDFDAPAWESALACEAFKVTTAERKAVPARQPSLVRLAHDGVNLYVRFTAVEAESERARVMPPPVDEFARRFPRGDHAEIWIKHLGTIVFAFDRHGNRYEAWNYDQRFSSGFRLCCRGTPDGWQAVLKIPLRNVLGVGPPAESLGLSLVRHLDHGAGEVERSTATGQPPEALPKVSITW